MRWLATTQRCALLLLVADCSKVRVDLEGLPCDPQGACMSGYVCDLQTERCVGDAADICKEGAPCELAEPCQDGGICKRSVCEATGTKPDGADCDDGAFCTVGETCTQGVCGGGAGRDCGVAQQPCLRSICNEATDSCEMVPVADDVGCDDGDPCTSNDVCMDGACAGTADPPPCGWAHRKQITIRSKHVAGDLDDFPVLIDLASDAQLAARARDTGDDLLFTDASLNGLSHEIEAFDGNTGRLVAWVRVERLSSTTDTVLYLYYGNPTGGSQRSAASVWDRDYVGVWHLDERADGVGAADVFRDATDNGNHGDDSVSASNKEGKIGAGQAFDGVDDVINCGSDASLNVDYITIELWLKITKWVSNGGILARGTDGARRYWLWTWDNQPALEIDEGGLHNHAWTVPADNWVHVVLTYDGNNVDAYQDGVLARRFSQSTGSIDATTEPLLFGVIPGFHHFEGSLDEVRISGVPRTLPWIKTSYNNQSSPATFHTVGPAE